MAEQRFTFHSKAAPTDLWPLLADTARFNEAMGLPKHDIIETPQADGSVDYQGRLKKGPFTLRWRERPVNWITDQWFEHRRDFFNGPFTSLTARLTLTPEGEGCRADYDIVLEPRNFLGRLLAQKIIAGGGKNFLQASESAQAHTLGQRPTAFDFTPPTATPETHKRVNQLAAEIETSGHGHGLAQRLGDTLLTAQEVDLSQLRPLKLARLWGRAPRETIELCLEATRAGLLTLRWSLLCPRCRVAKVSSGALDELPQGAHCASCNIDYGRDFSRNVELSFQPSPAVRPITFGEYCLFGPLSTPHVKAQLSLAPGERRTLEAHFVAGPYRYRTLAPGPEVEVELGDQLPALILRDGMIEAGAPAQRLVVENRSRRAQIVLVESRAWVAEALTADRVSTLQAFRDLFSDQVLRPGDEVAVERVTLMFTDLRASTALYGRIGDASAYHLVRDHFAVLTSEVRAHEGAIVKTIGDAIMAAFARPADALRAALAIQRALAGFNAEHPGAAVAIKIGLHSGPCIAVTLNDRLDYFGSTANLAARLQSQSQGDDIVLSESVARDADVAPLLGGLTQHQEAAALKGFDKAINFLRLTPGPKGWA